MEEAARLDDADPIGSYRDKFHIPTNWIGEPVIYFCGNSLGLQPRTAMEFVDHEIRQWREIAVEGHFSGTHPWVPYHRFVAEGLAEIAGASVDEVVAMNALTVNLHLLMVSFFRPASGRTRIVIENRAFPSDRYAVESQLRFHGLDPAEHLVELQPRDGETALRTSDIVEFLDTEGSSVALVMLGGVNYYTGQFFDIAAITEAAHRNGCTMGLDLAHAAGNVPLRLHDWGVDFAGMCCYKYLNAGPGAVGAVFIHDRHIRDQALPRFDGWWGNRRLTRFEMSHEFDPNLTAEGWQISNSPIFSVATLRASLEIFESATMPALRRKSMQLTGYLEKALLALPNRTFEIITPSNPEERGAQLSLRFRSNGRKTFEALKDADVVCDYREPDVIRLAPAPLYNTFTEAQRFVEILHAVSSQAKSD